MTITYQQITENEIQYLDTSGGKNRRGPLVKNADTGDWEKLNGEVVDLTGETVTWLTQSELDAQAAEAAQAVSVQQQQALKVTGQSINGYTVSLTEDNQNGLAAVMQGALLAESAGSSIFPLNFNARTATGEASIPFANKADYEAFCLAFMQARQQFF